MAKTVRHEELKSYWGDQDHLEVSQTHNFTQMIFELLSERQPLEAEAKLFDLILNISIDHGPETPSAIATIEAVRAGKPFGEAVGAGIAQINDTHGGAIEPLMEILYGVQSSKFKVESLVAEYLKEGKRMPGFGHRIYKESDPRAELVMNKAKEAGVGIEFIQLIKELGEELNRQSGKNLPINIDGAIATVLCGFGWESKLGKAVFIVARAPGLCAQYLNEGT